jgi:two-component system, chemotaxis family, response regulator Rcp1
VTVAPGDVLLVEDAEIHVAFTTLAFERQGLPNALRVARDGESALSTLESDPDRPPKLILLDLGLPRMSGFEVLEAIRSHDNPRVRRTPVVVLTTSRAPNDVRRAYDLCANAFVSKPVELEDFVELIAELRAWWLERVELP